MTDLAEVALRFLHILFAIAWVGAVFYHVAVLRRAMGRLDPASRKAAMAQVAPIAAHYIPMSAVMTLLFGFLLYAYLGRLDVDVMLYQPWGQTVLAGALLGLLMFGFGMTVVFGALGRLRTHLDEATCDHPQEVEGLVQRMNHGQVVVLGLGLVVLALMVLA